MITLSQAVKLTEDVLDAGVYLRPKGGHWTTGEWVLLKTIRDQVDMKRIKVHKIGYHPVCGECATTELEFEVSGQGLEKLLRFSEVVHQPRNHKKPNRLGI